MKKYNIKDFWEFNNSTCWRIQRESMVDMYLYLDTMRYIYKSSVDKTWRGTKNPYPAITLSEVEKRKIKTFKTEDEAVRWLAKIK